jgi:nicotinate phosphoribosyltransferase
MVARMKISEQSAKTSIPGCLDVARLSRDSHTLGDVIFDTLTELPPGQHEKIITIISPEDPWQRKAISVKAIEVTQLLEPLFENGIRVGRKETLTAMRDRAQESLATFDRAIFRFDNPHAYAAGLSQALFERRQMMRDHEFEKIKIRLATLANANKNGHGNGTSGT